MMNMFPRQTKQAVRAPPFVLGCCYIATPACSLLYWVPSPVCTAPCPVLRRAVSPASPAGSARASAVPSVESSIAAVSCHQPCALHRRFARLPRGADCSLTRAPRALGQIARRGALSARIHPVASAACLQDKLFSYRAEMDQPHTTRVYLWIVDWLCDKAAAMLLSSTALHS